MMHHLFVFLDQITFRILSCTLYIVYLSIYSDYLFLSKKWNEAKKKQEIITRKLFMRKKHLENHRLEPKPLLEVVKKILRVTTRTSSHINKNICTNIWLTDTCEMF